MYSGNYRQRQIIFEGNSLFNHAASTLVVGGQYVTTGVYNSIAASRVLSYNSYATSGESQAQINALLSTNITPYIKTNDVIVLWEGTNALNVDGLSAAAAFAEVVTYINTVIPYGVKLVIGTVIARDKATDAADLMTRIDAYNVLVRNNAATYGYTVWDIGANTLFDTRADASNGTYYDTDKVHQITAGKDAEVTSLITHLTSIL